MFRAQPTLAFSMVDDDQHLSLVELRCSAFAMKLKTGSL